MMDNQGNMGDGSVAQDGLRFRERKSNPGETAAYIPFPVTAIVTEVYTVENQFNRDEETILLDCKVLDMGIDLFKVPFIGMGKGSIDNYIHHGPVAPKKNVDKSPWNDQRVNPKVAMNDSVMIQFAFGRVHQPYAVAVLPHNQTENVSPSPRPKQADGDVYKVRFNGTNMLIDKDGNISFETTKTLDEKIPRNKKFTITLKDPEKTQAVKVEVDNTLNAPKCEITVTKEDGKFQKVKMDGQANEIKATNQISGGENSIRMHPGGLDVNVKGAKNETTTGAVSETYGGNHTINVTGNCEITASGNAKVTASGNVEVTGAQIKLNGSAGQVLTTVTDPVVDLITGAPTVGVPTVKAG